MVTFVAFIIFVALAFDFINGFHDAANSIATVVSTRVLTPLQAVVWAAFFNFVAAFGFGVHVATTVDKGVVDTNIVDEWLILAALVGAIVWDIITWYWGPPTLRLHVNPSSSVPRGPYRTVAGRPTPGCGWWPV